MSIHKIKRWIKNNIDKETIIILPIAIIKVVLLYMGVYQIFVWIGIV